MKNAFDTSLLSEICPAARRDTRERNFVQSNILLRKTPIRSRHSILEESVKKEEGGQREKEEA